MARWEKATSSSLIEGDIWLVFSKPDPDFTDFQVVIERCKQMQEAIRWRREFNQTSNIFGS